MEDALAMRRIERIAELNRDVDHHVQRQRLALDAVLERSPLEQLHHDEVPTFALVDAVYRTDVRVIQRRRGPGFALQPLQSEVVVGNLIG